MLLNICVLLAALGIFSDLVSGTNLRKIADKISADENIPTDHGMAFKAASKLIASLKAKTDAEHKRVAKSMENMHAEVKKQIKAHRDNGFVPAANMQAQSMNDNQLRWGSVAARHRPNGDCSGTPVMTFAERIYGECTQDGWGGSYYMTCGHENSAGEVTTQYHSFPDLYCMQTEGSYSYNLNYASKCQMETGYSISGAPEMVTAQCSAKPNTEYATEKGSVAYFTYKASDGNMCNAEPWSVAVVRFHTCWLINLPDGFFYMSPTGCTPEGKMQSTIFSDPACTRVCGSSGRPLLANAYTCSLFSHF